MNTKSAFVDEVETLAHYTWQNLEEYMIDDLNPVEFSPDDFDKKKFISNFVTCMLNSLKDDDLGDKKRVDLKKTKTENK